MAEKYQTDEPWTKNLDYLMELSAWERELSQNIYLQDYERAMRAADRILAHISFLLADYNESTGKKSVLGSKSQTFIKLNDLIAKGMREALAARSTEKNRHLLLNKAYNTARQVEMDLKQAIDDANLYFKMRPSPKRVMASGLSGQ